MDKIANIINKYNGIRDVNVVGYTDQMGTDGYNQALSERRVKAVEKYLDERSRLDTQAAAIRGLGKSAALEQCKSIKKRAERIACMREERRVEIEFKYDEVK